MTQKAEKSPYIGVDGTYLSSVNWELARNRVLNDVKSDFILAPHLTSVFRNAFDQLKSQVERELRSGQFGVALPIDIAIPKTKRLSAFGIRRQAPNFFRVGSILYPRERLFYQILADEAAPVIEKTLNRSICFSQRLAPKRSAARMFLASRTCWSAMQKRLHALAQSPRHKILLKADVAGYFSSINQHTLINTLESVGYPKELSKPLERFFSRVTLNRSSRGIVEGLYPSDLFGNFYLAPLDTFCRDNRLKAVRYVDDIYAFFSSFESAEKGSIGILRRLASMGLQPNESKTGLHLPHTFISSDPDLDAVFQEALDQAATMLSEDQAEELYTDYGFQTSWSDEPEPIDEQTVTLSATESLFDQMGNYPRSAEEIERFCLPIFARFQSEYALRHVLERFDATPSMAQIYCSYLVHFIDQNDVQRKLLTSLRQRGLVYDWQYMWILAALAQMKKLEDKDVRGCLTIATSSDIHEAVRAIAAILVAKFGDLNRQGALVDYYSDTSSVYMQTAILYSARYMQSALKRNMVATSGTHSALHQMVAKSISQY